MTRWRRAYRERIAFTAGALPTWSLVWRAPLSAFLATVALACFLADDALRALRRLNRKGR